MGLSGSFGINTTRTWTAAQFASASPAKLLDVGSDKRGKFLFVKAGAAITIYDFVGIDGTGTTTVTNSLTTTNYANVGAVGVAQVAAAIGEYLWVWVGGVGGGGTGSGIKGNIAASYVAYALLNTTATGGVADDAATKILGGVVGVAVTVGAAAIELQSSSDIIKVTA